MDAKLLKKQADKAKADAEQARQLAEHKADKAEGLDSYGAPEKAGVERSEAEGLQQTAHEYEQQAAALEAMIETAHKRVEQLNAEEEQLHSEYDAKLKAIDDERRKLLG